MKKFKILKNLILSLLVFSFIFNAIHIENVFAKNYATISSVVGEKQTNKIITDSSGKTLSLRLNGEGLENSKIKVKVTLSNERQKEVENSLKEVEISSNNSRKFITLDFPKNDTKEDKIYVLEFSTDGTENWLQDTPEVTVTVKGNVNSSREVLSPEPEPNVPPIPNVPEENSSIVKSQFDDNSREKILEDKGGVVNVELFTSKVKDNSKIKVQVTLNGEKQSVEISEVKGEKAKKTFSIMIPKNATSSEQVYTVKFNVTGSDTEFSDENALTVKVLGKKGNIVSGEIEKFTVRTPGLSKEGGSTSINVVGKELKSENLKVKVFLVKDNKEIEDVNIAKNVEFMGTDRVQSATLTFPAVTEKTVYKVKVGLGDEFAHEVLITVGGEKSNETTEFRPDKVYCNDKKTVVVVFHGKMTPVKDLANLKSLISIAKDGVKFEKLSENTTVDLKDDTVTIKLDKEIELEDNSKIKFEERALTNELQKDNKIFTAFINTNISAILDASVIEGEILESKGGVVKVKLVGENLNAKKGENYNVVAKVVKNEKKTVDSNIELKFDRISDKEQIISFNLPENTDKNAASYLILVSSNGGKSYSSKVGATLTHRTKKLVSVVLAKGMSKDKPILSFMTIQSYGTFVEDENNKNPDMTHTDAPVGQESKKTWVNVYGTNLKKEVTKVKIVDEFGVEWTPIQESVSDSMDQFIMIGFDHTGIDGNGNNQSLEIICPRNILVQKDGEDKPRSATYKYLVAVDGINFNEEIFVTATITDDKTPGKHIMSKDSVREVTINYVDESGKQIEPSNKIKGHIFGKAIAFNMKPKEIEGYEIVKYSIKGTSDEGIKQETFEKEGNVLSHLDEIYLGKYLNNEGKVVKSKLDEITYVYKQVKELPKPVDFLENKDATIKVEANNLKDNMELKSEKLDSSKIEALKDLNADLYDIHFTEKGKSEVLDLGNGKYKVTIKKSESKNAKAVYYVDENGKLENLEFIQDEKTVTFTTTHFSKYAIVYDKKDKDKDEDPKNPQQGNEDKKTEEQDKDKLQNEDKFGNLGSDRNKPIVKKSKLVKTSVSGTSALLPILLLGVMTVINKKRNK